ncbi:MAG TPA: hypothetical protein VED01_00830 [Burkholderiales bacterium]|nr:hypothetical protein [Burkholderiales bacterium]
MSKRFLIGWLVVFVAWMAGSFVVHGVLLHAEYSKLPNLFRPPAEAQQYFALMILAHVMMAGAFTWIYSRGAEAKAWPGQGVRFGIAAALLTVVPWYTIYYVVQPIPGGLALSQAVFDAIVVVMLGLIVAFIYSGETRR